MNLINILGTGNHAVYVKKGKLYKMRWFRKDLLLGDVKNAPEPSSRDNKEGE